MAAVGDWLFEESYPGGCRAARSLLVVKPGGSKTRQFFCLQTVFIMDKILTVVEDVQVRESIRLYIISKDE